MEGCSGVYAIMGSYRPGSSGAGLGFGRGFLIMWMLLGAMTLGLGFPLTSVSEQ